MAEPTGDLEEQITALRTKVEAQQRELDELKTTEERRTGRRDLFKIAGAAALGAAGTAVVAASPAGAAPGDVFYLAINNDAGSDGTSMTSTSRGSTLEMDNTGSGSSLLATDSGLGTGTPLSVSISNPSNDSFAVDVESVNEGMLVVSDTGHGAALAGGLAPLLLIPAGSPGSPSDGTHNVGEVYVDSNGAMYRCTVEGTPGSWVPLQATVPIANPARVVDSRHGTGGVTGPIAPGATVHTTSNLTGGSIPSNAVGLTGNVTLTGNNGALLNGYGVLTLFPAGAATPMTATIAAGSGCFAISNAFVTNLGTGEALSFVWSGGGPVQQAQVIVDVTGYIL